MATATAPCAPTTADDPRAARASDDDVTGLSAQEAQRRLARDGRNDVPHKQARSLPRIVFEVLREPMLGLLVAAAIAYLALGSSAEAVILAGFAMVSIVITVVQEVRTEKVLDALRNLAAPTALVMRDGIVTRIPAAEIVRGDLLVLDAGDRIAADGTLVRAGDLQVDESLITGESLPVSKAASASGNVPDGDAKTVFSGTLVTRGSALAEVVATGADSRIGRIGRSLSEIDAEPPKLRAQTARIVRLCAVGGAGISLLVAGLYVVTRGGWIDALLAGISVAMAMLPEEFPVVLTVFLAMGAWRIGQSGVLTRHASAIETLGSATVLCTDKTGTLTENRMALTLLWSAQDGEVALPLPGAPTQPEHLLLSTAAAACPVTPGDPMEIAIRAAAEPVAGPFAASGRLVRTHGLSPDLPAMSNVWDDGATLHIAAKGAPEAIATLCRLGPSERAALMRAVDEFAARGTRMLGVACATAPRGSEMGSQREYDFTLLGLVGLTDPIRPQIPAAVAALRSAGIRIVMITGDHAATARAIAEQAGLAAGTVLTGPALARLSDAALAAALPQVAIFARIQPEQKLRIVRALKAGGEIVGMIGDGVNDAPSLKAAHIGIAMGRRGTDVAREAASILLLDDDFGSIVSAVRLGRRIHDNIRKAMAFIFAVHVPLAGLALLPFALGLPILFAPIHIALIEMIIDPVCALVFEAEGAERDVMRRAPRRADEPLFPLRMVGWSVAQGILALAAVTAIVIVAQHTGLRIEAIRSMTFFTLVAMIVALILANRSLDASLFRAFIGHNRALRVIGLCILLFGAAAMTIPPLRTLLGFAPLSITEYGLIALASGSLLALVEATKRLMPRQPRLFASTTTPTAR